MKIYKSLHKYSRGWRSPALSRQPSTDVSGSRSPKTSGRKYIDINNYKLSFNCVLIAAEWQNDIKSKIQICPKEQWVHGKQKQQALLQREPNRKRSPEASAAN